MKLAHFYESVANLDGVSLGTPDGAPARQVELANELVQQLRHQYDHIEAYQRKYNPSLEDEKDDPKALEVLRSIWRMFDGWLAEAEPVYDAVRQLPAARHVVQGLDELRDKVFASKARAQVKPEDIIRGMQQLRRGEGIRTTVQELRNELHARRGA
jgi:hypothetical protein